MTTIEWTEKTWNPSTGCSRISKGCRFCYAETLAKRLHAMGNARYENGFEFTIHWDKIEEPLSWKKPRKIFVNSMSDLFHEDSSLEFIARVFDVMMRATQHQFQVLTKRPNLMADWLTELQSSGEYTPMDHIWLGTSIEHQRTVSRVNHLKRVPANLRFLSCEPLLGPLDLDLTGIHWVIVGGESGAHMWKPKHQERRGLVLYQDGEWIPREDRVPWVTSIRDQCVKSDVAFFFKQWGGARPKVGGRELEGEQWSEYPEVRETPM